MALASDSGKQFLSRAVEVPVNPNVRFEHLTTVNLTVTAASSA